MGILTIFQDYPTDNMSESQLSFLQHLREIGLVFQRKVIQNLWSISSLFSSDLTTYTLAINGDGWCSFSKPDYIDTFFLKISDG